MRIFKIMIVHLHKSALTMSNKVKTSTLMITTQIKSAHSTNY